MKRTVISLLWSIRNIRIQTRLISSFFVLSLVPLLITGVFSYSRSRDAIKSKISTYSVQIVDQVSKNIQRELARLEYDSVDIAISDIVQKTLSNYENLSDFDKYSAALALQESVVKKFSFLHYVSDVLLYTNKSERIIAYGDDNMFNFKIEPQYLSRLLKEAEDKKGAPVWSVISKVNEVHLVERAEIVNDMRYGIIICRSIKDLAAGNRTGYRSSGTQIGYIIIRTNEKYISDIYRDIDIGYGAEISVIDSEGYVISSRNPQIEISKKYRKENLMELIKRSRKSGAQLLRFPGEKEASLIAFSPIGNSDWYVVCDIPFSYLNSESENIGAYTFSAGIVCFFMAVLLSLYISKSISLPLRNLIASMNEAKKGNLISNIVDTSSDEIAEVTRNYNDMLHEIKRLLEDIKHKEVQKRATELKALQAQINPHFLSNTLNTAKWLANMQNAKSIERLLTALIDLLHASVGSGNELVTLNEEINYLKNYILIQEYKYFDKFEVRFEIQNEALDMKILKFLLQPLVENSIIHGIEPLEGRGIIVIKAYVQDELLKIIITDNGVGISESEMRNILSEDKRQSKSKFSGIGLSNVEERIKLFFGEQYGIHIESVPYLFTTLEMTLPAMKGGN